MADARCDLTQADHSAWASSWVPEWGTCSIDDGYKTLYAEGSNRIKPFTILLGMHNAAAAWIGIEHDIRGPNLTYSTACSSCTVGIGEAWLGVARVNSTSPLQGMPRRRFRTAR